VWLRTGFSYAQRRPLVDTAQNLQVSQAATSSPSEESLCVCMSVTASERKSSAKSKKRAKWLMCYAACRKAAGSSPNEVLDFFNLPNPASRTMAVGFTRLLTETSTSRSFCG
jgi:hypothetical protein